MGNEGELARRGPGGRWLSGGSGNPGGRPADAAGVRQAARALCVEAIGVLAEMMRDRTVPARVRVAAALALLDRGVGRPLPAPARLEGGHWPAGLSDAELDAELEGVRAEDPELAEAADLAQELAPDAGAEV